MVVGVGGLAVVGDGGIVGHTAILPSDPRGALLRPTLRERFSGRQTARMDGSHVVGPGEPLKAAETGDVDDSGGCTSI